MSDSLPSAQSSWILCRDPRLSRLLETELAYLGIPAVTYPTLPPASEEVCLLIADGDEFGVESCLTLAVSCGCPILIFGREETALSEERVPAAILRRPFALTALEKAVRRLLPSLTGSGCLPRLTDAPNPAVEPVKPAPSTLIAQNGVITVGEHTVTLTPAEWAIFDYLNARPGETVTREELAPLLGGGGNIVDVYVCRLRSKIEKPLGRRMIRTVRGVGYVLHKER